MVQVNVNSPSVEGPLRTLRRKLAREGIFKAVKLKRHYEKPSVKQKRKSEDARRRRRKSS